MQFSLILRRFAFFAAAAYVAVSAPLPARAQALADKIATNAAHAFVNKISGESCSDFAATMAKMKQGGSGSGSSSSMASKLKGNPQARTDFVNIVAAPLLNKMIDCNMMPGGM
jgi:hypothetical protein